MSRALDKVLDEAPTDGIIEALLQLTAEDADEDTLQPYIDALARRGVHWGPGALVPRAAKEAREAAVTLAGTITGEWERGTIAQWAEAHVPEGQDGEEWVTVTPDALMQEAGIRAAHIEPELGAVVVSMEDGAGGMCIMPDEVADFMRLMFGW